MRTGLAVGLTATALLLSGCGAAPAGPQQLEVTYADAPGGTQSTHTVEIAKAECSSSELMSSIHLATEDFAVPEQGLPEFDATMFGRDEATRTYVLMVRLSEGVYFGSQAPFEVSETDGLRVVDLPGVVSVFENGEAVENLDSAATLSATLACQ